MYGKLVSPESNRDMCERAQGYLEWEDCPSQVEVFPTFVRATWIYKDTWPNDPTGADFKYSLALPLYAVWGRKKREKYIQDMRNRDAD